MGWGRRTRQSGVLQRTFFWGMRVVVDAGDVKDALGQGAGLVKDYHTGFGEGLQIVGAFTSTPARLAPADPAKKLRGMLMTRAQGQLATRKVRAR